ncbi:MAG: hypothetical protein IT582_02355 [Opitutaceae bacterium]|nr:hypothetical protein [Opitutaceae bacterium]
MKTLLLFIASLTIGTASLFADEEKAGPQGGRLLDSSAGFLAEFVVTPEHFAKVNLYGEQMKPIAPTEQSVMLTAELPGGVQILEFKNIENGFISTTPLPDGEPYRVVLRLRNHPDSRPHNFRIDLNLTTCGECQLQEYACICEGH